MEGFNWSKRNNLKVLTLGDAHQTAQLGHSTLKPTVNNPHPPRSVNRPPCIPKHLRKVCNTKDRNHKAYLLTYIHTYIKQLRSGQHEQCREKKLLLKNYVYHPQRDKGRYSIHKTRTEGYFFIF